MKKFNKISVCLLIAIGINWLCGVLKSDYPAKFLEDKIVEVLITLIAINAATVTIIVTKLEEISRKYQVDLSKSIKSVKESIYIQITLVIVSFFCLILFNSKLIRETFPESYKSFFDTILLTAFLCAIAILQDTGLAIFVINDHTSNIKEPK